LEKRRLSFDDNSDSVDPSISSMVRILRDEQLEIILIIAES
jgi:hypothetical protein